MLTALCCELTAIIERLLQTISIFKGFVPITGAYACLFMKMMPLALPKKGIDSDDICHY
jgi:hypothetical protein